MIIYIHYHHQPQILPDITVEDESQLSNLNATTALDSFMDSTGFPSLSGTTLHLLDSFIGGQENQPEDLVSVVPPSQIGTGDGDKYDRLSYAFSQLQRRYDDLSRDMQIKQREESVASSDGFISLSKLEQLLTQIRDGQKEVCGSLKLDPFIDNQVANRFLEDNSWSEGIPSGSVQRLQSLISEVIIDIIDQSIRLIN